MGKKKDKAKRKHEDKAAGDGKPVKMSRKDFDKALYKLQIELCRLQAWVKETGFRAVVIFEGRDAAGKGGVIKRIMERVSPRVFRLVALPAPTDREKTQLYMQRYISHLPAAGEIILFDRSWYNRAGVERVMGFCTEEEAEDFLALIPAFERVLVNSGIMVVKYFFDVSAAEQERRFHARLEDPAKQWKLSPMDVESYRRWWDYTHVYDKMISRSDTEYAPWYKVPADIKRSARLNCISHLLSVIPYERVPVDAPDLGKRKKRRKAVADRVMFAHVVPQPY